VNDARDVIPFYATFFSLAAILAVIASLERILGRSIPRLRNSRTISKSRLFWAVPILMAAVLAWVGTQMLTGLACSLLAALCVATSAEGRFEFNGCTWI
jgi:hypothetical protein